MTSCTETVIGISAGYRKPWEDLSLPAAAAEWLMIVSFFGIPIIASFQRSWSC